MWIRSQDGKALAKVTRLAVVGRTIQNLPPTGIEDDYDVLGRYKTPERAIEVLDDVQKHLENAVELTKHLANCSCKKYYVYQMPKE